MRKASPEPADAKPKQTPESIPAEEGELARLREQHDEFSNRLLHNIKARLPKLEELLARLEGHWGIEDGFYRFYHQSFKVYQLQDATEEICASLRNLLPERPLNRWFSEIISHGTGHKFEITHNQDWLHHTRPIL